jgi:hypothetical protein
MDHLLSKELLLLTPPFKVAVWGYKTGLASGHILKVEENPKSECRNSKQYLNSNFQTFKAIF